MPLIDCIECGHKISDRATACPQCGHPNQQAAGIERGASATSNSETSPKVLTAYTDYKAVPWYRRSSWNTFFILVGFATKGYVPLILITCVLVLTGDIYFKEADAQGNLKSWGRANRYAAIVLLVINAAFLLYLALEKAL